MALSEEMSIVRYGSDKASEQACLLNLAFDRCLALDSRLPEAILSMQGMSGRKYRRMINVLVGSMRQARYLEVGSWAGSTACSAMYGNKVAVTCIDNWTEFGGPKDVFFANINAVKTELQTFAFHEADFRQVDYGAIGRFNIYLFDGPHEYQDQYDGIAIAQAALDDEFVLIVDDWNFARVREGTLGAIAALGLRVGYGIEVRTTQNGQHAEAFGPMGDWHNGYFLAAIKKS